MKKIYILFFFLIAIVAGGYILYDYFFGPPTVTVRNHTAELIRVVFAYPGGEKTIPDLSPGKSRKTRLRGITSEGGVSVTVNGQSVAESFGYVGPYPGRVDIVIEKLNERFVLK